MNDPQVPTKTSTEGVVTPKEKAEWNDKNMKKVKLNAKAINMMQYHGAKQQKRFENISKSLMKVPNKSKKQGSIC